MARAADLTRQSILKAATTLFAEKGFEGTSVRAIVTKARVNQAAINYHFDGKEGLYGEILESAFAAFTREETEARSGAELTAEAELRRFIRHQLRPLLARDEVGRYLRIFAWETARPSKVLRQLMASNATPFVARAVALVRRFLPADASEQQAMCAAIWLMGQCNVFVRNREHFTQPPFALKIDEAFVEQLTDLICRLALHGLAGGR
jgi:TetR/AcrR family transcriptional regulator, regulator of cefoperazone and chloramphenicol sensitivity